MVLVIKKDVQGRETLHPVRGLPSSTEGRKLISKIPRQVESLGGSRGLNKEQPLESLGHCGCGSSQGQRVDVSPEDQEEVTGLWVRPGLVSCFLIPHLSGGSGT